MNKQLMAVAIAAAAALAAPAHATTVALAADGSWSGFDVDNTIAADFGNGWIDNTDGSALNFTFTVGAGQVGTLTVVDTVFAGDTFTITNFGGALGTTSSVAIGTTDGAIEYDFAAALANPAYSHGVFSLQAGTYSISGALLQSVQYPAGGDVDATSGGVSLTVAAVPEPSGLALMLGGFAAVALLARRRRSVHSI